MGRRGAMWLMTDLKSETVKPEHSGVQQKSDLNPGETQRRGSKTEISQLHSSEDATGSARLLLDRDETEDEGRGVIDW